MTKENRETIFISREQANIRLDKVLTEIFSNQSRTYFQYLIENSLVLLNGETIKKRSKANVGDEITICFALTPEIKLTPEAISLNIMYEDDEMIAINKPVGMVVHPAPGNWSGTFVNALLNHCQKIADIDNSLRPGIVHRLDKDTSGLLIAAKNLNTQQKLIEQFANKTIEKHYLAICIGNPGNKTVSEPIGRDQRNRKKISTSSTRSKEATTIFSSLKHNETLSLVRAKPLTGRTHQIRVHLKHIHCPVLGDELYGNKHLNQKFNAKRQMLHAEKLILTHPKTNKKIELCAPIPDDMQQIITKQFE